MEKEKIIINGHEAVDLGLCIKCGYTMSLHKPQTY